MPESKRQLAKTRLKFGWFVCLAIACAVASLSSASLLSRSAQADVPLIEVSVLPAAAHFVLLHERAGQKLLGSSASGGFDAPFAIGSLTKTMTAVAVLRLVDRGVLELEEEARRWLPPAVVKGFGGMQGVRIRDLMAMTSGMPDYFGDAFLDELSQNPAANQRPAEALSYAFHTAPHFSPGAYYDFSNSNYLMLQLVLENASGLAYADLMQREVFEPATMSGAFVAGSRQLPASFPVNANHDEASLRQYYSRKGFGDGGVICTALDLAAFYRALLIDKTLVAPDLLAEMLEDAYDVGYGLGIQVDRTNGVYGHTGGDEGFSADVVVRAETADIAIVMVAEEMADLDWAFDRLVNHSN